MLIGIIKKINEVLEKNTKIDVISQDIDKNIVLPCIKTELISYDLEKINKNLFNYNIVLNINYYPKQNIDKRIEMIDITEKLNNILAFDIDCWTLKRKETNINENFISILVEYDVSVVYSDDKKINMKNVENEDIEKISFEI